MGKSSFRYHSESDTMYICRGMKLHWFFAHVSSIIGTILNLVQLLTYLGSVSDYSAFPGLMVIDIALYLVSIFTGILVFYNRKFYNKLVFRSVLLMYAAWAITRIAPYFVALKYGLDTYDAGIDAFVALCFYIAITFYYLRRYEIFNLNIPVDKTYVVPRSARATMDRESVKTFDDTRSGKPSTSAPVAAVEERRASPQILFCRHCGKRLPAEGNYCSNCGAQISQGRPDHERSSKIQELRNALAKAERTLKEMDDTRKEYTDILSKAYTDKQLKMLVDSGSFTAEQATEYKERHESLSMYVNSLPILRSNTVKMIESLKDQIKNLENSEN